MTVILTVYDGSARRAHGAFFVLFFKVFEKTPDLEKQHTVPT
jgi:hypothetical protein